MALLYLFPRRGLPTTGSELACFVPANFTTHTRTRSARLSLAPETWERGGERKWKEEKRKKEEKKRPRKPAKWWSRFVGRRHPPQAPLNLGCDRASQCRFPHWSAWLSPSPMHSALTRACTSRALAIGGGGQVPDMPGHMPADYKGKNPGQKRRRWMPRPEETSRGGLCSMGDFHDAL